MKATALALALALAGAGAVHTRLESSRPSQDERLEEAPSEIRLRFSTSVQLPLSGVELRAGAGRLVRLGRVEWVPGGEAELRVPIEEVLGIGSYEVSWRTAGPDSHAIEGSFQFSLAGEPQEATAPAPDSAAADSVLLVDEPPSRGTESTRPFDARGLSGRLLFYLATVLLIGVVTFRWAVIAPAGARAEHALADAALTGLRRVGWATAFLGIVGAGLRLSAQLTATGAGPVPLLFQTPWGWGWWLHLAGLGGFTLGLNFATRTPTGRPGWIVATAGALAAALAPALSGHAWAVEGSLRWAALSSDALHVLAAGAWMGSLAVLALVALPLLHRARDADGRVAVLPLWVASFSRVALTSVILLLLSGGFNAWLRVGSLAALTQSSYGRTLMIKLGVLAGAAALGFYNWRVVQPALQENPRAQLLRIPALLELAFGLGVLLVTAALVVTPLP